MFFLWTRITGHNFFLVLLHLLFDLVEHLHSGLLVLVVLLLRVQISVLVLVRSNSIACSAKTDIKVTLCPDMILVLFEVVFLPQGALKYFVECSSILFR